MPVSPHEWLLPKLTALVDEAAAAGIARDVSVAVIDDLINAPPFNTAPPETDEGWNQDIGEPDYMVNENDPLAAAASSSDGAGNLSNQLQHFALPRGGRRR